MCRAIHVLVCRKLDSHTCTMCTSARSAVQDRLLRNMICVPRLPEESAETHMTRWTRLLRNCKAKHKFPHGDETYFAGYFFVVRSYFTYHDDRSEDGNKQIVPALKYGMASEPTKGTGHAMSWTALQSLEVGAGSGSMSWR